MSDGEIHLRWLFGQSVAEIAEAAGKTVGAVEVLIHKNLLEISNWHERGKQK